MKHGIVTWRRLLAAGTVLLLLLSVFRPGGIDADMLLLEDQDLSDVTAREGLNFMIHANANLGYVRFGVPSNTSYGELVNFQINDGTATPGPAKIGSLTDPFVVDVGSDTSGKTWLIFKMPKYESGVTTPLFTQTDDLRFGGVSFGEFQLRNIKQKNSQIWIGAHGDGMDFMAWLNVRFEEIHYSSTGIHAVFQDVTLRDSFGRPFETNSWTYNGSTNRPPEAPGWDLHTGGSTYIMDYNSTTEYVTSGSAAPARFGTSTSNPATIDFSANKIYIRIPVSGSLRMHHAWYGNVDTGTDYGFWGFENVSGTVSIKFPMNYGTTQGNYTNASGWQY
ncbi:MAG: hypothetical protein ACLFOY_10590 [Desulfatibacillaceae bacterium]